MEELFKLAYAVLGQMEIVVVHARLAIGNKLGHAHLVVAHLQMDWDYQDVLLILLATHQHSSKSL
jgi:hypothetical protein